MVKDKLIKATCISCDKSFWTTKAYVARIKTGLEESLCKECSFEPPTEGIDNSAQEHEAMLESQPDPEDR